MEILEGGRYLGGLFLTIGLLLLAWWLVRRFAPGMVQIKPMGDKQLSIVEALHLDPRRRIVRVRDGEREHVLLLGLAGETLIESRPAAKLPKQGTAP
ncbi:hypothetical protein MNBD_ALPHA06-1458 [hydrothermal vent metagenome]|uniref:Flagellar biosynthesis protein FliO n=1 Tax=hydrothermal vent metagenome TaxID=652676 RepID=A0A3B0RVI3_9ZZZZ